MQRDVLTVLETASALNLYPETVKRFCRIGKLKGEKVSVGWLIPKTEVESFASTYKETRGRPSGSNGSTESAVTRSVPQRQ